MAFVIKSQTADETVYISAGFGFDPNPKVEIVIKNDNTSKTYDSIPPKDIVQGVEEIAQLFQADLRTKSACANQIWKSLSTSGKLFLLEQIEKSMSSMSVKSASAVQQALQVDAPLLDVADKVEDDVEKGNDAEVETNDSLKTVQAVTEDDSKQSLEKVDSATSAATASAESDDKHFSQKRRQGPPPLAQGRCRCQGEGDWHCL
ncbi:hypothetical protein JCM10296v2_007146 [Rhodotorula toruloides]